MPLMPYYIRRRNQRRLKKLIRLRLATEDYICRLPRPPKPRVRYKLTLMRYRRPGTFGTRWVYA